ncbi:dephospho-CoA kinase [Sphingomonas jatrophae]|uniref:Dephospho-CoA kinase n=1 Tax=Sphingomonas jatrophae TaxID=1166337 RepID=A0A1I6LPC1_9SPHN|nr:dephospho-CoA kinase [Sphingomonas jatrophae]SFS05102.1 dephospho-CoA kinase [Sphingomonas jatrophae]
MTIRLGLTGSIGMGKSTVATMFRSLGVPLFDGDAEVHRLQAAGGAAVAPIEAAFPGTTGPGGVDRQLLGARVLGDAAALARLEAIVHPMVAAARTAFLDTAADAELIVFDIPLLYEKSGPVGLDAVAVVSAPADQQRTRVLARPGMTEEKFARILALQLPDAEKRARADFIIETGTTLADTEAQVAALVACLRAHGVGYCRACARSSLIPKPQG